MILLHKNQQMMNEMIRNNLTVATMHQSMLISFNNFQPEWGSPRFVTIVKQQHKLDEVSYHKLFDILKQYQKEVNELRAERMAKNANPFYEILIILHLHELDELKGIKTTFQKNWLSLQSTSRKSDNAYQQQPQELPSTHRNKNVDTTPRYKNDNQTGQFGNQRTVNFDGAREMPRHEMKDIDEQELEAHYSYMEKIHGVETGDSNVIPDLPDMCDNDIQDDQNDVECDDERVALANLKLDVDENKKIQKQLKKANATLTQELTECKSILAETSRTLGESNSIRDSCLVA
ncbi:hypothetical protein Tco_0317544 [Tanacetum coccineum]